MYHIFPYQANFEKKNFFSPGGELLHYGVIQVVCCLATDPNFGRLRRTLQVFFGMFF